MSVVLETNVAGMREALRRLAMLAEWEIWPPNQHWAAEAEQYDVSQLIRDMLDDEKLVRHVQESKGMGRWFVERLVGKEASDRLWRS